MATAVKQRRGNTSEHGSFTGLEAEITVNTETKTIHVHDGSTAGGIPLAKASELGATVTVTDNSDDTAFPVVFHNESSAGTLLDDTGEFTYNPNDGVLTVPFRLDLGGQGSSNGSQINFSDGSDADFFRILELNSDIYFSVTGTNADMLFSTSHSNSVYKFDVGSSDTKVEIAHDNTTLFHNLIFDQGTIALKDASDHVTTIQENAGGNITLTLPSATGTIALTSDITVTADSTTTLTNKSISGGQINSGTIPSAQIPTLNQDTTGNAATATIAKGAAVIYDASNDGAIGHATVAGFVGKTVVYTNTVNGDDLTLGLPDVGVDIQIGEQIHLINASTGDGATANIILHLDESGTQQKTNTCTGAIVVVNDGTSDPKITAGGVATLIATADNTYALFGSGVQNT
jgi:hypothetical protein